MTARTMVKEVSLFPRRPELTAAEFRTYYETRHVPLALRYNRVFAKYTRNFVVGSRANNPVFDAMTEIWYLNPAVAEKAWSDYARFEEIVDDEQQFMDRSGIISLQTAETVVVGPSRSVELEPVSKIVVLLRRPTLADSEEFAANASAFARRSAAAIGANRTTLDVTVASLDVPATVGAQNVRPDAIVSVAHTTHRAFESTVGVEVIGVVDVEQVESPAADLHD
jgi:hypothetical protein